MSEPDVYRCQIGVAMKYVEAADHFDAINKAFKLNPGYEWVEVVNWHVAPLRDRFWYGRVIIEGTLDVRYYKGTEQ